MIRRAHVLLVAATPAEFQQLVGTLDRMADEQVAGRTVRIGRIGAVVVAVVAAGIGKANAAMATATVLERCAAAWVLSMGVGGAYPDSDLQVGDLAGASEELYGDDGVEVGEEWQGLEATGVPLWRGRGNTGPYYNRLPVDPGFAGSLHRAAAEVGSVRTGPFVTVSTVTGTRARAELMTRRFHPVCENMEGAAVAHATLIAGRRFAEVRGVSNLVGPRDRASWQLDRAAAVAQRAAVLWLHGLAEISPPDPAR
jgi:futalosine hydrolase